jgi:hypothetical protein
LIEHSVLQRETLPDESWRTCWKIYIEFFRRL